MKKLTAIITALCILLPLTQAVVSCSEEADCSMAERKMLRCNIYTLNSNDSVVNDTLDSLTVTAFGTDSIIINNQKKVHDILLPLQYTIDSTKLVFRYSRNTTDTILIRHTNTPHFLSMDCGFQMKQTITGVRCSYHKLDSISTTNNEAGINGRENIRLFY